jgi:hypothetical protein
VQQQDVERIARTALKELGVTTPNITVTEGPQHGQFRVTIDGGHHLTIRCGPGSTAQWVRAQIFDQYLAQG